MQIHKHSEEYIDEVLRTVHLMYLLEGGGKGLVLFIFLEGK